MEMSSQDGAEAQGTQVRQTPRRLDPSLTLSVHMPRASGVNICRGGRGNGASHAFPTFPSIPQSCAPLTFAARRAQIGLHVSLPDARRQGGGDFWAQGGCAVDGAIQVRPQGERKTAPSHPTAPRLACLLTPVGCCFAPSGRGWRAALRARRARCEWPNILFITHSMAFYGNGLRFRGFCLCLARSILPSCAPAARILGPWAFRFLAVARALCAFVGGMGRVYLQIIGIASKISV